MPDNAQNSDPLLGFNFLIDASGKGSGNFADVSGISSENEVVEHKVMATSGGGQGKEIVRKIPGRLKWGDITLKRGITSNLDLWKWRKEIEDGKVSTARVAVTITMMDQAGKEIAKWELENTWPSKITGPSMSTESSSVGIEELTLVCEGFTRSL